MSLVAILGSVVASRRSYCRVQTYLCLPQRVVQVESGGLSWQGQLAAGQRSWLEENASCSFRQHTFIGVSPLA